MQKVAVLNESTVVSDEDAQTFTKAVAVQVRDHVNPAWDTNAQVGFVPKGAAPPDDAWQIVILDDSDQADALGYHDLAPNGLPLGKVFAKTVMQNNSSVSVTLSHETGEEIIDPWLWATAFIQPSAGQVQVWAIEPFDPVESDDDGYDIEVDGKKVRVSNFVFPAWYTPETKATKLDYMGQLKKPFAIQQNGYISMWSIAGGWQQATTPAGRQNPAARPHSGSRREKRRIPRDEWRVSRPQEHRDENNVQFIA